MSGGVSTEAEALRVYRARRTVLQMLDARGYSVAKSELSTDFAGFKARFGEPVKRELMVFLTEHRDDATRQVIVFFPTAEKLGMKTVKDLYIPQMTSNNNSIRHAIIVLRKDITAQCKKFIDLVPQQATPIKFELFQEEQLLVNITEHSLVPQHIVLTDAQRDELLARYKLRIIQLPRIRVDDPIAKFMGLERMQVVKIIRASETAGRYVTYRLVA